MSLGWQRQVVPSFPSEHVLVVHHTHRLQLHPTMSSYTLRNYYKAGRGQLGQMLPFQDFQNKPQLHPIGKFQFPGNSWRESHCPRTSPLFYHNLAQFQTAKNSWFFPWQNWIIQACFPHECPVRMFKYIFIKKICPSMLLAIFAALSALLGTVS